MKENNNFFEAVSKITNVENNNKTEIYKIYEKLYVLINEKLKTILSKIWDDDKWSLKNSVDCVITEIEMFMRYPFIYNKICIGILDNRNKKINNYLLSLSVEDDYFAYMQQRIIPTIIYNDKNINKILVTNNSGNIVKLSIKELKYFLELNKKLKFDKLAKSCAITAKLNSDNICYINLPQQNSYNFSNDEYVNLTKICAGYILICENEYEYEKIPSSIKSSNEPVYIFSDIDRSDKIRLELKEKNKDRVVEIHSLKDIDLLHFNFDILINNSFFIDELQSIFQRIRSYISISLNKINEKRELFNRESLYKENGSEEDKIIKKLNHDNQNNENEILELEKYLNIVEKEVLNTAFEFKRMLEKESKVTDNEKKDLDNINDLDNLKITNIILALKNNDINTAKEYFNQISSDYPYKYILDLYFLEKNISENVYGNLSFNVHLQRLKNEKKVNNFVLRAKLHFAESLNLNNNEIFKIINNLTDDINANERYLLAEYYKNIDESKAIFEYIKAFEMGYTKAGEILVEYYQKNNDFFSIKKLADKNIAKAALYYSDYCMVHNKYKAAMCYLKISASLKYIPAIHKYATLIYKNVNYRNRENMKNILPIYLYIYEHKNENEWKNYLIQDIAAKIGSIYFWDANYVNAKKFLEENIDCEISNYFLGMMYFNGYGVVQNLEKAKYYFERAVNIGSERAEKKLNIVNNQISKEKKREQKRNYYDSERDYSSSSTYVSSSSSWCFITTAVCQSLNKPDDCEELNLIRSYRDNILSKTDYGKILIKEYYKIAPEIVAKIDKTKNSKFLYQNIYNDWIEPISKLILQKNYQRALQKYCNLVRLLADKYSIKISDESHEIIKNIAK